MNENKLTIEVYSSGTTRVTGADDLALAEQISFDTFYPGGLFGAASFFVPRDPTASWQVKMGQRMVLRNGQTLCWEGTITAIGFLTGKTPVQGCWVEACGFWGEVLGVRTWQKWWADDRITAAAWEWQASGANIREDWGDLDRDNRLRFTPKAVAWTSGKKIGAQYSMPFGETVKRVVMVWTLSDGSL